METQFKYAKLRGRIIEKYGTVGNFAKEGLNTSMNTVSRKMNDKVQFSKDEITKWCDLLDISVDEVGVYFFT